jgi:secreted PhoX family phosphatase
MKKTILAITALAIAFTSCKKVVTPDPDPTSLIASSFSSGFKNPIGMAFDDKGQIWVTENGTGNNDAQISVVTPDGKAYPAITGFNSYISQDGPEGLTHLLFKGGKLYILHAEDGKLYTADVSGFKPGSTPISAGTLPSEDIGTFVTSQNLTTPAYSDAYNLTFGPDGDLYIADAGGNAIIKRNSGTGTLSLFAKIPKVNDSTESVPTGILYDGHQFLISGFSGFPFVAGTTNIYKVDLSGNVSIYKGGYTALTDIALTFNNNPLVLQMATFVYAPPTNVGFQPLTGEVLDDHGKVLISGLAMPTDLLTRDGHTFYVLSRALGTIQKLTNK